MNKPFAFGLIVFFILIIAASGVWIAIRPAAPQVAQPVSAPRRFPFGLFGTTQQQPPATTPGTEAAPGGGQAEPSQTILTLLSPDPVAGFTVASGSVRYIELQTGHVVDIGPRGGTSVRISNTTLPRIFDVTWSADASRAVLRYTDSDVVRTVSATFGASSTQAAPLAPSLLASVFSPFKPFKLLLFAQNGTGGRLLTADADGSKQTEALSLPSPHFQPSWIDKNTVALVTKPSGMAPGFLFTYDLTTKRLTKILGDIPGLETAWSSDAKQFVYSAYDAATQLPHLWLFDMKTRKPQDLGVATLASKCVFGEHDGSALFCGIDPRLPAGLYPDDWLQGVVSPADELWKLNLVSFAKTKLPVDRSLDIKNLRAAPDDSFLYFMDKKNNSLWSYSLKP